MIWNRWAEAPLASPAAESPPRIIAVDPGASATTLAERLAAELHAEQPLALHASGPLAVYQAMQALALAQASQPDAALRWRVSRLPLVRAGQVGEMLRLEILADSAVRPWWRRWWARLWS